MGLWDTIAGVAKQQFLEVIQWIDEGSTAVVYRFPVAQQAITDGSKLVVREGQAAVFLSEGKMSEVFGPGSYDLGTRNAPILQFFQSIKYGLNMPYKGDILFVSTKQFTDQKWGTPNPIPLRDKDFGIVRIRAFGNYAWRVTDPAAFIRELVGANGYFTTDEITGQLKRKLVSAFADTLGEAQIPLLDLVAKYLDLGDALRQRLTGWFQENYGITLTDFVVENISVPPEVEKMMDKRAAMAAVGDLNAYTQMQAADAMRASADHPGSGGGFMQAGMGLAMGNAMGSQLNRAMGPGATPPPPPSANFRYHGPAAADGDYPADQIAQWVGGNRSGGHMIWAQGWPGWKSWSDVPEIAGRVPAAPPPLPGGAPPPLPGGEKFHYAGADGAQQELSASQIAQRLAADPAGRHLVWRQGMDGWKPANTVPEITAALGGGSGGPPPLP